MKIFVIWVDREHAKVFEFSSTMMERKNFEAHRHEHHSHRRDNLIQQREENSLFSDIAAHVRDATNLLLIGPGVAKHHFQNYLTEHHPALARIVSACQTVDHPSDAQIAALARKVLAPASEATG